MTSDQVIADLLKRVEALETEVARLSGRPTPEPERSELSLSDKVELFMDYFRGRQDVHAHRWEKSNSGKKGWSPRIRSGVDWSQVGDADYLPLNQQVVDRHLRQGQSHVGLYVMNPNDTCYLLACDFDNGDFQADAAAYASACRAHGLHPLVEISRSGEGAHVWIFFEQAMSARTARKMGFALLREAMGQSSSMSFESYDRFFPAQDTLPVRSKGRGRLGNLIALPLNGDCRARGTTVFVDPETWVPYADQWAALANTRKADASAVEALADTDQDVGPDEDVFKPTREEKQAVKGSLRGKQVRIRVAKQARVPLAGLPGTAVAELKHLASLPNPEFYRRQATRMSTWGQPRIIIRFSEQDGELLVPRGIVDSCTQILQSAGAEVIIDREGNDVPADFDFFGELKPEQDEAVKAMADHHAGIIVAPPGAGKTVMACALIARRGQATAVIVNRRELATQWKTRLKEFLDLDVGQQGAGKHTLTGQVDIFTLQSLSRHDSRPDVLNQYGQIIVDECHNVAAPGAEAALTQAQPHFIVGLTATPFRSDRLDALITMICGPVRFRGEITTGPTRRELVLHTTRFTTDSDTGERGAIQQVYNELAADIDRNEQLVDDVVAALKDGGRCLILVNRKAALRTIASLLSTRVSVPVMSMEGNQSVKERDAIRRGLEAESFALVAMSLVAGEGLDIPQLDTLFLGAPISFKGVVIQQLGRLTRGSKPVVTVHDYVDEDMPVLAAMHRRRLRQMKKDQFVVV